MTQEIEEKATALNKLPAKDYKLPTPHKVGEVMQILDTKVDSNAIYDKNHLFIISTVEIVKPNFYCYTLESIETGEKIKVEGNQNVNYAFTDAELKKSSLANLFKRGA